MNSTILENYVMAEMLKSYHNHTTDYMVWSYRDKDNREVDMMIETDGQLHPLEIKWFVNSAAGSVGALEYWIRRLCQVARGVQMELSAGDRANFIVPVWMV